MEHFDGLIFSTTQAMGAQRTCAGVHVVEFDLRKKIDTNVKRCSRASRLKASSLAYNP
jgi:hypothetical protein